MFHNRVKLLEFVLRKNQYLKDFFFLRGCSENCKNTSDADVLVASNSYSRVIDNVIETVLDCNDIKLISYMRKSYFFTITIVYKLDGRLVPLKIDLINDLGWYGINSINKNSDFSFFYDNKDKSDELQLIVSHIQKLATAGLSTLKPEISGLFYEFVKEYNLCIDLVNKNKLTKWQRWKLRFKLSTNGNIYSIFGFIIKSSVFYIKNNLTSNPGKINLSLSGMDGAGKSTLIDELKLLYIFEKDKLDLVHLLRNTLPMPHQLFKRKKTSDNYLKPYSEDVVNSNLSSTTRLFYYLIMFLLDNMLSLLANIKGKTVIYDRCSLDFFVDLSRSKIKNTSLKYFYVKCLNKSRVNLCLFIKPSTSVERKDELTLEKASYLYDAYNQMAGKSCLILIDAEQEPKEVLVNVLKQIEKHLGLSLNV